MLALWRKARERGERVALATVVHVQGSSYRKPGARMLVTSGGERAGTVSGGCLEAEVSRKIWWLTADGPRVERYHSSFDEDVLDGEGVPWGLGCGGTVTLLLEQEPTAVLQALAATLERGLPSVVVARLAHAPGTVLVSTGSSSAEETAACLPDKGPAKAGTEMEMLQQAARRAHCAERSLAADEHFAPTAALPHYFVEYLAPAPHLAIFGAGEDAEPIAAFADALGWRVTVADGRTHMLRPERFPPAAAMRLLTYGGQTSPAACLPAFAASSQEAFRRAAAMPAGLPAAAVPEQPLERERPARLPAVDPGIRPGDLAVILTHSFEQDRALLAALLPQPLGYLGILGPRHRTLRLLGEVAPTIGCSEESCLARLHTPVGLDLGAHDPASIALSIVAEMQAALAGRRVEVTRARRASNPPLTTSLQKAQAFG